MAHTAYQINQVLVTAISWNALQIVVFTNKINALKHSIVYTLVMYLELFHLRLRLLRAHAWLNFRIECVTDCNDWPLCGSNLISMVFVWSTKIEAMSRRRNVKEAML
eukprot:716374_1